MKYFYGIALIVVLGIAAVNLWFKEFIDNDKTDHRYRIISLIFVAAIMAIIYHLFFKEQISKKTPSQCKGVFFIYYSILFIFLLSAFISSFLDMRSTLIVISLNYLFSSGIYLLYLSISNFNPSLSNNTLLYLSVFKLYFKLHRSHE